MTYDDNIWWWMMMMMMMMMMNVWRWFHHWQGLMLKFWIIHLWWSRILCINISTVSSDLTSKKHCGLTPIFFFSFSPGEIGVPFWRTILQLPVTVLSINANAPGRSFPSWKAGIYGLPMVPWIPKTNPMDSYKLWIPPKINRSNKKAIVSCNRFRKLDVVTLKNLGLICESLWLLICQLALFGNSTFSIHWKIQVAFKNVRSLSDVGISQRRLSALGN